MMVVKNYYNVLNVNKDADEQEIKKAYRKLAREFHPDINTDKNAEEKFKQISEAYAVLSDNEKRMQYNFMGDVNFSSGSHPNYGFRGMPGRSFCKGRMGMGQRCGMGRFNPRRFNSSSREPQIEKDKYVFNLSLSFAEAVKGIEKDIFLNRVKSKERYKAIIPSGTKDGDLIEITSENLNTSNGNYFLRITITE
ncbi:MAG: DnaJ domain-containing protein [Deltaproteobacteria bacterium]|nr:DnaJ domain-containing protein [Deltaproteobacteria bacterium]